MTVTTGMSISGKMSVRIWVMAVVPRTTISNDITANEYGRCRASRTIHMASPPSKELLYKGEYRLAAKSLLTRRFVREMGSFSGGRGKKESSGVRPNHRTGNPFCSATTQWPAQRRDPTCEQPFV